MALADTHVLRLTVEQAADYLGVKKTTLDHWRSQQRHDVPYIRIGGAIRYDRAALDRWMAERTVSANGGGDGE